MLAGGNFFNLISLFHLRFLWANTHPPDGLNQKSRILHVWYYLERLHPYGVTRTKYTDNKQAEQVRTSHLNYRISTILLDLIYKTNFLEQQEVSRAVVYLAGWNFGRLFGVFFCSKQYSMQYLLLATSRRSLAFLKHNCTVHQHCPFFNQSIPSLTFSFQTNRAKRHIITNSLQESLVQSSLAKTDFTHFNPLL